MPTHQSATHKGLAVFISHSSKDAELALALIDLLKAALALRAEQIRCSSVDGYRLPVGVNTESKLREEVKCREGRGWTHHPEQSCLRLYVSSSLEHVGEPAVFWLRCLAGVKASELSGPLGLLNALSASNDAQIHQLIGDIANHVGLERQPADRTYAMWRT